MLFVIPMLQRKSRFPVVRRKLLKNSCSEAGQILSVICPWFNSTNTKIATNFIHNKVKCPPRQSCSIVTPLKVQGKHWMATMDLGTQIAHSENSCSFIYLCVICITLPSFPRMSSMWLEETVDHWSNLGLTRRKSQV